MKGVFCGVSHESDSIATPIAAREKKIQLFSQTYNSRHINIRSWSYKYGALASCPNAVSARHGMKGERGVQKPAVKLYHDGEGSKVQCY